jgi:hypothetical protein
VKDRSWSVFVSNFNDNGSNVFYIMPLGADSELFRSDGVPISFYLWCGDWIFGHELYPGQAKKQYFTNGFTNWAGTHLPSVITPPIKEMIYQILLRRSSEPAPHLPT